MSNALAIFLAGIVIALYTEPVPKWLKTVVWVALAVIGVVMGALSAFRV